MVEYKLRYFSFRGRGESIRWIFHHTGMEFEDERIEFADWPEIKPTVTYQQLPILEFDGKTMWGAQTIVRFLARLFGLCGQDDVEAAKCDELVDSFNDFIIQFVQWYFFEGDEEKKEEMKTNLLENLVPKYFTIYENAIVEREGGKFLVEENVTWADLFICSWMDSLYHLDENLLEPYPNLKALNEEVRGLPGVKDWIENRPVTDF